MARWPAMSIQEPKFEKELSSMFGLTDETAPPRGYPGAKEREPFGPCVI